MKFKNTAKNKFSTIHIHILEIAIYFLAKYFPANTGDTDGT